MIFLEGKQVNINTFMNGGREAIESMSTAMTEHGVKKMAAFNDSITNIQHVFQDLL